jgi:hypothetical protein
MIERLAVSTTTVGWSDCGCACASCEDDWEERIQSPDDEGPTCEHKWRNGTVLDPFAGSGTTLEVATGLGLDAIGIDLDERNHQLAIQRVGMFLQEGQL